MNEIGKRYIGLDVHKHYLIALGVDEELQVVLPARRVELTHLEAWMKKTLTRQDEVVLEMTTNTWQLYDELVEYAGSVTVVHPPVLATYSSARICVVNSNFKKRYDSNLSFQHILQKPKYKKTDF